MGAIGPAGPTGRTGPAGKNGHAGQIELVSCRSVKTGKGKKKKTVQKCIGRLVSGTVNFTVSGAAVRASISRGRLIYATGASVSLGWGARSCCSRTTGGSSAGAIP